MKRAQCFNILLALILLVMVVPTSAFAYENAKNRINIINQYDGSWKTVKWKVHCTASQDLETAGCGTFALAHAIQWLHNEKMDVHSLVTHMLDLGCHTNGDADMVKEGVNRIKDEYGLRYEDIGTNPSKDKIKTVFNQNGVIITNIGWENGGHYILAVGYKEVNGQLYIQMVDSSVTSTAGRFTAYVFDDLSKTTSSASQYWLTYEQFSGAKKGHKQNAVFRWSGGEHGFALYFNGEPLPDEPVLSNEQVPSGDLQKGSPFPLRGTIKCNTLRQVRGVVLNRGLDKVEYDVAVNTNATSYSLGNEIVNNSIVFGKLDTGYYTYMLLASYIVGDVVLEKELIRSDFTVGNPGSLTVPVQSIELEYVGGTPYLGAFQAYKAVISPENATIKNVVWTIGNEHIAISEAQEIDNTGTPYIILRNKHIGDTTLRAEAQDGSGVSAEIPITVFNNMTGQWYFAYREVDGQLENLDLRDIQLNVGDELILEFIWTWTNEPETYYYRWVLEEESGLEFLESDSTQSVRLIAKEPGTYYVFLDFFENDEINVFINPTITVQISCEHTYTEGKETKKATCTEEGRWEIRCDRCNELLYSGSIPALGHLEVTDAAVAPTWYKTGLSEGSHCQYCNTVLVSQQVLPSLSQSGSFDFVTPLALKMIEEEAFAGISAVRIKLGEKVTEIRSRAFADCKNLEIIYIPSSVIFISDSAFDGTSCVILGYRNSQAQAFAENKGFVFEALDAEPTLSDWVIPDVVPSGATIVDRIWTYTETMTSLETAVSGWTQRGFTWVADGGGTVDWVDFSVIPGFNTGHASYAKYNKTAPVAYENGNEKREISTATVGYLYWHWMYSTSADAYDRAIFYQYGYGSSALTGNTYLYKNFGAFESTSTYSAVNGNWGQDDTYYTWYKVTGRTSNADTQGSYYWYRTPVNRTVYTDLVKQFTYTRFMESYELPEGENISEVQEFVRYQIEQ